MIFKGARSEFSHKQFEINVLVQDGISMLQKLEILEVVGARALRVEGGVGRLPNLKSLEFNSCE